MQGNDGSVLTSTVAPATAAPMGLAGLENQALTGSATTSGTSPELILLLAQQGVSNWDQQIDRLSQTIQGRIDRSNQISRQVQALDALATEAKAHGNTKLDMNPSDPSASGDGVYFEGNFYTGQELVHAIGLDAEFADKGNMVDASTFSELSDQLNKKLQAENSGNEIDMMRLQQLMQRRSETLSLATNLLRSMHEADQSIIRNVGV